MRHTSFLAVVLTLTILVVPFHDFLL